MNETNQITFSTKKQALLNDCQTVDERLSVLLRSSLAYFNRDTLAQPKEHGSPHDFAPTTERRL